MSNDGKEKPANQFSPDEFKADLEEAVERSYGKKIVATLSDLNEDVESE